MESHGDGATITNTLCTYTVFTQSSANQIGLISGSPVAYTHVTVLTGPVSGSVTHKSVYQYNKVLDEGAFSNSYPFPPPDSYDWLRGKLVREQDYRYDGTTYQLIRQKVYTYRANFTKNPAQTLFPNQAIVTGYRVFTTVGSAPSSALATSHTVHANLIYPYHYYSASVYLTKTTETLYDTNQQPFTTTRLFDYNDQNLLVQRERSVTSQLDTLVRYTHYYLNPTTAGVTTANSALRALRWKQQHHVLNQPLETTSYLLRADQPPLALQRSLKLYQVVGDMSLPLREYASQGGSAVKIPISYAMPTGDSLVYDATYYPLIAHQRYDEFGNIQQQSLPSGRPTVYLYGYRQKLLTTHVVNARWAQLASTSFEEEATGRWHYDSTGTHRVNTASRTGHWAYRLDGTASVSRGQLPAGNYELMCWVQGALPPTLQLIGGTALGSGLQVVATAPGDWHQYRGRVRFTSTGQVSLDTAPGSTAVLLDELRLYPVGAQLTSYTHDPLVGETSQTDPTGRTVTYEYDALGRLIRTRDEQGRILSQQQYHYAGAK